MKVRLLVLCSVLVCAFVALTAAQSGEITKAKTSDSLPVPIEEVHDHKGCNHDHDHDHDHHEHSDTVLKSTKPEEHAHDEHEHEHDEHEHDEHADDEHDEHEHEHEHEEEHGEHEHEHEDGKHDEHEHDKHDGHKHDEHEHEHNVQAPTKSVVHNHDQHNHGKGEAAHKENNAHRGHDHHGHAGGKCPFSHGARKHEQHAHDHHEPNEAKSVKLRTSFDKPQSWLYAIGATLFISAAPVAILPFVPLDRSEARRPLLKVLLSFAVGGLLGDVFLHLLPHSMTPHNHEGHAGHSEGGHDDHGHGSEGGEGEDLTVGLFVLAGILVFFLVEKFVRASGHSHSHGGHSHGHSHGGHAQSPQGAKKNEALEKKKEDSKEQKEKEGSGNKKNKKNKNKKKQVSNVEVEAEEIKTGGWLNLVADATHNFTDGLALASSFQASTAIGLTTTVAVLLHEIPHEIGDFAILVQSGFPRKKAMYLQFATGFGALAGCLIGLVAEGFGSFIEWVLPFTAGGFIYIATVGVIPDLLEDTKLKQSVKEALAACTGVALMVLVARLEHMEFFAGIV